MAIPPPLKKKVVQNLLHRFEISEAEALPAVPAVKEDAPEDAIDVDGKLSEDGSDSE